MRLFPILLGVLIVVVWLADRLPVLLNASVTTTIAINCLMILTLSAYLGTAILRLKQLQQQAPPESEQGVPPPRPLWVSGMTALMYIGVTISVVSVLVGYIAFGSFIIRQAIWLLVVLASAYLLSLLVENAFCNATTAGWPNGGNGGARRRTQIAVLFTGLARLSIVLFAAVAMLAPFGEGSAEIFHRLHRLHSGVAIGEVRINPASMLQALMALVLTLAAVKILKRWLIKRYLPTTEMDPGMQVSAATLFGYAGTVLAVALALSAVGIGLERVTWIASALSVGIGFGLQAVVQNFVSGLILLAERPVKVCDWVSLGGIEGDIRRINVRATEIQMTDRSTVIVPNSEFITKTVRNITHASPLGLVQIKLPLPLNVDAQQVQQLLLQAFQSHAKVMETPKPEVFLDGIENGNLMFKATGFVTSPRAA
jgi:small-conductance mechanosensitive channel